MSIRFFFEMVFITAFAPPVWYDCNTKRRHFCYYKYFQKKRDTKREDIWYYDAINQPYFYYHRRIL